MSRAFLRPNSVACSLQRIFVRVVFPLANKTILLLKIKCSVRSRECSTKHLPFSWAFSDRSFAVRCWNMSHRRCWAAHTESHWAFSGLFLPLAFGSSATCNEEKNTPTTCIAGVYRIARSRFDFRIDVYGLYRLRILGLGGLAHLDDKVNASCR